MKKIQKIVIGKKESLTGLRVPLVEQKGGAHRNRKGYDRKREKQESTRDGW